MKNLSQEAGAGHYARKQLLSKDRLIAWSHRSRFETGLRLARRFAAGGRVLDYGCGDGTFLSLLLSEGGDEDGNEGRNEGGFGGRGVGAAPRECVGAEVSEALVQDCRRRLGARGGLSFVQVEELDGPEHRGAYRLVVCMEVLEHVVEVGPLVERLGGLLAPGGRLLVSVPVETGLPLVVKQLARRVAGWRGIGDYPGTSPYTFGELCAGLFARSRQHIKRPVHTSADGALFHDHKGFNWMRLRETLAARFRIEMTLGSPLAWLPPHLASQAWFVLSEREGKS